LTEYLINIGGYCFILVFSLNIKQIFMLVNDFINEIQNANEENISFVRNNFLHLNREQLNRKPSAEKWSIGELFTHLITTHCYYFKIFIDKKSEKKKLEKADAEITSTLNGRMLIKFISPGSKMKVKSPKIFLPAESSVELKVIEDYLTQAAAFGEEVESSKGIDISQIKISSPAIRLLKFNLAEAYQVLVNHDKRHLLQAEKIMQMNDFFTKENHK
jgi:hypothetical protein